MQSAATTEDAPFVYQPYTRSKLVTPYWTERYEREAAKNWDLFYRRNRDRFFKDRHYLQAEWPELAESQSAEGVDECDDQAADRLDAASQVRAALATSGDAATVLLEAGCGVGNTLFPLLAANPKLRCFAFDFSDAAVAIVQEHPLYSSGRIVASVGDLTEGALPAPLAECRSRADLATLMFVLSAISPEKMAAAVASVASGTPMCMVVGWAGGAHCMHAHAAHIRTPRILDLTTARHPQCTTARISPQVHTPRRPARGWAAPLP